MSRVKVWVQRFADRASLQLQWHDPDSGRRRTQSAGTADPEEAERKRADLEYELNHGLHEERTRLSWERFRELFEREYLPLRRPATRKLFRHTLDCFERLARPTSLRAVTARVLSAFAASLHAEDYAPQTIKVTLQYLRTVLRWAAGQKLLASCPKMPPVKVPRKKPQPVPLEHVERLLDAAGDDHVMRTFLLCGWLAGLRLAEAFTLEWEPTPGAPHLSPDGKRIVLPAELCKGDEDQWLPLDPRLAAALESLPRLGRRVFLFPNRRGGHLTKLAGVSTRVIALARRAGLTMSMRTLRRAFGCRYAAKVPAQVLQRLLRHADIRTTLAFYANIDDALEAAVAADADAKTGDVTPDVTPGR